MSVYSGFPTRELQTTYNLTVFKILHLMSVHINDLMTILKSCSGITHQQLQVHDNFSHRLGRLKHRLREMEGRKYLEPKFSEALGLGEKEREREREKSKNKTERNHTEDESGEKKRAVATSLRREYHKEEGRVMKTIEEEDYRQEYKSRNVKLKKIPPTNLTVEVGEIEIPHIGPKSTRSDKRTILASGRHLRIYRENASRLRLPTEQRQSKEIL